MSYLYSISYSTYKGVIFFYKFENNRNIKNAQKCKKTTFLINKTRKNISKTYKLNYPPPDFKLNEIKRKLNEN